MLFRKYSYLCNKTDIIMAKWQNFFLQKMGTDTHGAAFPTCESVAAWGVFCKSIPFKLFEKVKEPANRSWHDEDGDDEYVPADGLRLEAYTMEVEFGCKLLTGSRETAAYGTSVSDVRARVGAFLNYLRQSGMMMLYSSYTRIGRKNVRLESVRDDAKWKSENGEEWLIFKVSLKVNDPSTDITYRNGGLVEA